MGVSFWSGTAPSVPWPILKKYHSSPSAWPRSFIHDLVIPHQANMRIIESVAKKTGVPMERVFTNVHRYGNMSAATVPVALCEALEEGRVKPGALLLMPSFGGGLTFTGHVVRWGDRVKPIGESDVDLPPPHHSALEIVKRYRGIASLRVQPA
jgi:3-oxoacyl-[acyl-carrier-protein] synthase-3